MSDELNYIEAKTILSKLRGKDNFFGLSYNMNLYRGCQHGCVYCDTRSECYRVGDISKISVKRNAIDLLRCELSSKRREKGTIGTGSMNDPYMPVEERSQLVRRAMQVIADARYPMHVITKSKLVMRDYDLLQDIHRTYAAVSFSITTADEDLARKLEPNAATTSERFEAMQFLAAKGIYVGVTFMPLLPFINDTQDNVRQIVRRAKDAGASYILPMFGVTLRKGSRDYFYRSLDHSFPAMKNRYEDAFGEQYICNSPDWKMLNSTFDKEVFYSNIDRKMRFFENVNKQLSLF